MLLNDFPVLFQGRFKLSRTFQENPLNSSVFKPVRTLFILCLVLVQARKTGKHPKITKNVDRVVKHQHK